MEGASTVPVRSQALDAAVDVAPIARRGPSAVAGEFLGVARVNAAVFELRTGFDRGGAGGCDDEAQIRWVLHGHFVRDFGGTNSEMELDIVVENVVAWRWTSL